ncbi:FUSC family protein [Brachybacterium timonense]|uniref:FUSC family protein n=1 Tax=Brachybacterium timonense TaxID=2050896 RepID=UPI000D0B25C9|nr:FUSC family protein [Brachybacterium timonense]
MTSTSRTGGTSRRPSWRTTIGSALDSWWRTGARRGRSDALNIARAALAAALAYALSHLLWGHQYPFFSSIVAFIVLGVGIDRKMRKTLEMGLGVMMGVLLGELARSTIGPGTWQIAVVIFTAGMLARLLDPGITFAFQMAIQSLLVMLMPVTPGMTPGARVLDAITGLVVALVIHLLLSGDPRRLQRRAADSFFEELEDALAALAGAARSGDTTVVRATLVTLRERSQKHTDAWRLANEAANEMATFAPGAVRHAQDVERLQHLLVGSDRAMRNMRVIARRQAEFLEAVQGGAHTTLSDALMLARDAVTALRSSMGERGDTDFTEVRRELRLFCSYLTPEMLLKSDDGERLGRVGHFEGVALVMQLRSLAIDLLQATGLDSAAANRFLPSLLVAADGDAMGPKPLTREMRAVEPPATTAALELLITDRSDPDRRH